MEWNIQAIRRESWNTTFRKGWRAWFMLVAVCFIFAFIGASNASQATFVDSADQLIGAQDDLLPGNIDYLKAYIVETPLVKYVPFITSELALAVIDSLSKSVTWVVRLLAVNLAYFERNPGEVIANMVLAALITTIGHFFIQNVIALGLDRYAMENRFQRQVPLRRTLALFHKANIWNLMRVMVLYRLTLILWSFTIVGGVYKFYQYSMVPYILAENPSVSWREAKRLSAQMTEGYKWKIFLAYLSYFYIWPLKAVPVAGLLIAVPLEAQLNAEIYFTLRRRKDIDHSLLIEPAFSGAPYAPERADSAPSYVLGDLSFIPPRRENRPISYSVTDVVFMFFAFCFVGWVWEVCLHLVQEHNFANRGTLYGPWIPIYGVGGAGIVLLLDRFKQNKTRLFALAVALCAVLEYLSSFVLDFMFNASYWDYKGMFMNLNGRICLAGLLAFGFGGLFGVYAAAPAIHAFAGRYSRRTRVIAASLLCAAFIADIICCLIFGFNSGAGVGGAL